MTDKMWAGRFEEKQSSLFEEINYSIEEDKFLAPWDIKGSMAHARGLEKIGIFSKSELTAVLNALAEIESLILRGEEKPLPVDEDVHMWIERLLTEKVGAPGKKLHTGRSRNDQVVTAARLWMKDAYREHTKDLHHLIETLTELAEEHKNTLMPGFTHLQAAQPIFLGFYFMAYGSKLKRDCMKLQDSFKHLDVMPLGSGALAGANYPIDRSYVAEESGFGSISENAMDAVSDRDFVTDYLYLGSMIMTHLSSLSEDFILWNSPAFDFISLSDKYSSGSSIMPQKKNPDGFELIRGRAALMTGRLMSMLGTTKGLPMSYNKDLQGDKRLMYDTYLDLKKVLKLLPAMLKTAEYKKENMSSLLKKGYVNATDLADTLVEGGMPFREAHEMVGKAVSYGVKNSLALEDIGAEYYEKNIPLSPEKIYRALDYERCISNKQTDGSTGLKLVEKQISAMKSWLKENLPQ